MSLLSKPSFGGGVEEQKFKPLCSELVSDWVSSKLDDLTIRLLRISSFIRDL